MTVGRRVSRVRVPAKINLFLEVIRQRDDAYHEIDTIMQTVTLYDELTITENRSSVRLSGFDGLEVPEERNLVHVAAARLREVAGVSRGCTIHGAKRIPWARGLGGGSADAAATLVALNDLWDCGLDRRALVDLAAEIGSDVPFFLYGGTARCRGRGERVEPLDARAAWWAVLVVPDAPLATARVYAALDAPLEAQIRSADDMLDALVAGDLDRSAPSVFNRLDPVACSLMDVLSTIKERVIGYGALACAVSGSGSTVFGLARDGNHARRIAAAIASEGLGDVHVVQTNVRTEWMQSFRGEDQ